MNTCWCDFLPFTSIDFSIIFFAFKNMFWYLGHSGVRRETTSDIKWWKYITYQVLFLFPKWLLLRLGDGYNFRVSVLMTFSRNILDSRKMLVSTFLVLPTRHVSTVITGGTDMGPDLWAPGGKGWETFNKVRRWKRGRSTFQMKY